MDSDFWGVVKWRWQRHKMTKLAGKLDSNNPLGEFYKSQCSLSTDTHSWCELEFLAIDLETSGLDSTQNEIVSIGWVCISQGGLLLNTAEHHIIRAYKGVGSSAKYHLIRDAEVENGESIERVMMHLLDSLSGRIAIFHNAKFDIEFLDRASRSIYGSELIIPAVDTMQLERDMFRRMNRTYSVNDLRLYKCRERYNLPQYSAHNALIDAIATAELYMAMMAHQSV